MSKRARYDGPHEEVVVIDSQEGIYAKPIDVVKRGGLLTADAPARIRDELLASADWTAVSQRKPKPKRSASRPKPAATSSPSVSDTPPAEDAPASAPTTTEKDDA